MFQIGTPTGADRRLPAGAVPARAGRRGRGGVRRAGGAARADGHARLPADPRRSPRRRGRRTGRHSWCWRGRRARSGGGIRSRAGSTGSPRGSRPGRDATPPGARLRERRGAEAAMAIRRVERRRSGRVGGLAGALRGAGPAPRAVPAADPALPPGRADLRAGRPAARLPGPHGPVAAGPGARAAARPADPPRRGPGGRAPGRASEPGRRPGVRLRELEARHGAGGGPPRSGRSPGRPRLRHGRCTGRRSLESHDPPSSDEMGGVPVVDRRRRGRCGDGDAGPIGAAEARAAPRRRGRRPIPRHDGRGRHGRGGRRLHGPDRPGHLVEARRLPARRAARRRDRVRRRARTRGRWPA